VHSRSSSLAQHVRQLKHAASPIADVLAVACDDLVRRLEGIGDVPALAERWGEKLAAVAESEVVACRHELLTEAAERDDDVLVRVEPLLETGRFAEAIAALRGHPAEDTLFRRATLYRAQARYERSALPTFWTRSATTHQNP
jgi:hypothetical protein